MNSLMVEHAALQRQQHAFLQAVEAALKEADLTESLGHLLPKDSSRQQPEPGTSSKAVVDEAAGDQGRLLTLLHRESKAYMYIGDGDWMASNGMSRRERWKPVQGQADR